MTRQRLYLVIPQNTQSDLLHHALHIHLPTSFRYLPEPRHDLCRNCSRDIMVIRECITQILYRNGRVLHGQGDEEIENKLQQPAEEAMRDGAQLICSRIIMGEGEESSVVRRLTVDNEYPALL